MDNDISDDSPSPDVSGSACDCQTRGPNMQYVLIPLCIRILTFMQLPPTSAALLSHQPLSRSGLFSYLIPASPLLSKTYSRSMTKTYFRPSSTVCSPSSKKHTQLISTSSTTQASNPLLFFLPQPAILRLFSRSPKSIPQTPLPNLFRLPSKHHSTLSW